VAPDAAAGLWWTGTVLGVSVDGRTWARGEEECLLALGRWHGYGSCDQGFASRPSISFITGDHGHAGVAAVH
jgi:hypothetical protein